MFIWCLPAGVTALLESISTLRISINREKRNKFIPLQWRSNKSRVHPSCKRLLFLRNTGLLFTSRQINDWFSPMQWWCQLSKYYATYFITNDKLSLSYKFFICYSFKQITTRLPSHKMCSNEAYFHYFGIVTYCQEK